MKITKSFEIKQPRERVWDSFNDVRFVAGCLPGASITGALDGNRYQGRMSVKVGPMAAVFNGEIGVDSRRDSWTGVVSGKGADPGSGSRASGSMNYSLSATSPTATRVEIVADINLAGALAQFGKAAVVQEIANRITAAFVANLEAKLADPAPGTATGSAPCSGAAQDSHLDAGGLLWAVLRNRIGSFLRGWFGRSERRS